MKGGNKKNKARVDNILDELGLSGRSDESPTIERAPLYTRKDNECGKVCYPSVHTAKQAIGHRLRVGANCSDLRHYFCDICNSYHMTSSFHK